MKIALRQLRKASYHFSPENAITITHEQNIICSKTHLDGTTHEQTIICRYFYFAGHLMSSANENEGKNASHNK